MSTSSKTRQQRFHSNYLEFCDLAEYLVSTAEQHKLGCLVTPFMVKIGKEVIRNSNPDELLEKFIAKSYPYWSQMKSKDENFFRQNGATIIGSSALSPEQIASFNSLFDAVIPAGTYTDEQRKELEAEGKVRTTKPLIDAATREEIWSFVHASIKLSISHIHFKREPKNGKYTAAYFPEISLKESVETWGIREFC